MRDDPRQAATHLGRRRLILGSAGALAGAALAEAAVAPPIVAAAGAPLPAPKPIAGGLAPGFHVFAPGPTSVTLPFSDFTLQGLNVEPNTITDFDGVVAVAFHAGTATGSDGKQYSLETDLRVFEGTYAPADGPRRRGTFALI